MGRLRTSLAVAATAGALVSISLAGTPSADAATRRAVPNTAPTWVTKAHSMGRASARSTANFTVYLGPSGGTDALKAAVAKVSDPSSPSYRDYLTANRYHARYDASDASVAQVSRWLTGNKLKVTAVEAHHRYLTVRGSVAAVQKAFGVTINTYKHHGVTVQANNKPVTVPATLAGTISGVSGLDTTPRKVEHNTTPAEPPAPGFRNARPCSASYGQLTAKYQADYKTKLPSFAGKHLPYAVCGYTGPQLRAAYENNSTLTGKGVTVALTDAYASPTIRKDVSAYAIRHGDGSYTKGQYSQVLPKAFTGQAACGPQGWYGEQTLDVEAVHAMAPEAKIRYYASSSCYDDDFLTTLNKVVDDNVASIVSNSWSDLEANESVDNIVAYQQVFLQGAMQGIGFMFSSGDSGDNLASTGLKQVDYPGSDPYVTSVGGTADAIGADGKFNFQTGWGTQKYSLSKDGKSWSPVGYLYGAGGGSSNLFNRPSYQDGVVPARFGSGRAVPDVGLDADPTTGFLVGQTQTFSDGAYYAEYRIGGTSLASPLYAGMAALVNQQVGGRIGFLNPTIYSQYKTGVFTDIKGAPPQAGNVRVDYANGENPADGLLYSIRTFDQDSSLTTVTGWDNVTGLGSPNYKWLTSIPRS
ncbi:MAG: S53 family peptidase [Propionibacteriaceae bacterium]